MCSTFKASLAACILSRVGDHRDNLEELVTYDVTDLQEYAQSRGRT